MRYTELNRKRFDGPAFLRLCFASIPRRRLRLGLALSASHSHQKCSVHLRVSSFVQYYILRLAAVCLCLVLLLPGMAEQAALQGFAAGQYQYVAYGQYPQAADGAAAPIIWRVLKVDGQQAYLLSEYIVDVHKLHDDRVKYPGWTQSDMFQWLQEGFAAKAFSQQERAALLTVDEGAVVSLAASAELQDKALGFADNESRRAQGTPWALRQGEAGLYVYRANGSSPYWTRTPSAKQKHAQRATKQLGEIGYAPVHWKDIGVRPVILVDLNQLQIQGGSGTPGQPYLLVPGAGKGQ